MALQAMIEAGDLDDPLLRLTHQMESHNLDGSSEAVNLTPYVLLSGGNRGLLGIRTGRVVAFQLQSQERDNTRRSGRQDKLAALEADPSIPVRNRSPPSSGVVEAVKSEPRLSGLAQSLTAVTRRSTSRPGVPCATRHRSRRALRLCPPWAGGVRIATRGGWTFDGTVGVGVLHTLEDAKRPRGPPATRQRR